MPKLYRVILPVMDIEDAAAFYGHVLDLPGERVSPGRHYFDCDGTILACYDPVADGDDTAPAWRHHFNQYIYFAVEDLSDVRERVHRAGGTSVTEITSMPWGERLFYALDPFGNPISFVEDSTAFTGEL
ncbi:MAG TPA: VOC family protein [Rhodothermia bacterium]|nr:VOC family protein [Rhodothermia bacterium]